MSTRDLGTLLEKYDVHGPGVIHNKPQTAELMTVGEKIGASIEQ
jgi:hypothetical protein